jgi:hypothetical protein
VTLEIEPPPAGSCITTATVYAVTNLPDARMTA